MTFDVQLNWRSIGLPLGLWIADAEAAADTGHKWAASLHLGPVNFYIAGGEASPLDDFTPAWWPTVDVIDVSSRIDALAPGEPSQPMSMALENIISERERQIEAEGWTQEHDDEHVNGEMAGAAACYALASTPKHYGAPHAAKMFWPWAPEWWKPTDPRRVLVKAGALIVAEIERLDRLGATASPQTAEGGKPDRASGRVARPVRSKAEGDSARTE